jgi:hypothetical protein
MYIIELYKGGGFKHVEYILDVEIYNSIIEKLHRVKPFHICWQNLHCVWISPALLQN